MEQGGREMLTAKHCVLMWPLRKYTIEVLHLQMKRQTKQKVQQAGKKSRKPIQRWKAEAEMMQKRRKRQMVKRGTYIFQTCWPRTLKFAMFHILQVSISFNKGSYISLEEGGKRVNRSRSSQKWPLPWLQIGNRQALRPVYIHTTPKVWHFSQDDIPNEVLTCTAAAGIILLISVFCRNHLFNIKKNTLFHLQVMNFQLPFIFSLLFPTSQIGRWDCKEMPCRVMRGLHSLGR